MFSHTAKAKVEVENEIDRYITWPGQALAYKIGELEFRKLRKEAEEKLGDLFDIKGFHYTLLESYGPMSIVKKAVNSWIQETLSEHEFS